MFPNSEIRRVWYQGETGPRPAGTVLAADPFSTSSRNDYADTPPT